MDIDLGILKNIFSKKEDIKNNLTSTDTDKPLSAAQGKELQRQINNITSGETPTSHQHSISDVTNLQSTLNSKMSTSDYSTVNLSVVFEDDTTGSYDLVYRNTSS